MRKLITLIVAGFAAATVALYAEDLGVVKQRMAQRLPQLATLKKQKTVGEDRAGYVQVVDTAKATSEAKATVDAENADRREVYAAIAASMKTDVAVVAAQRARQIRDTAAPGVMLQAEDGSWYEQKAGQ